MIIVYLIGNNISDKVVSVSEITESAGDYGQLTIVDIPSISGDNTSGFWDKTEPASPFYGALDLSKYSIKIENNGVVVFDGVVQSIEVDQNGRSASISLKSNIQKNLEKKIIYASTDNSTPSEMVEEICSLYGIDINSTSFSRSNSIYTNNSIKVSAFYKGEGTVLDAIQQIAEIGIARAYIYNQQMNFDVFRPRTAPAVFTVSDDPNNTNGITLYSSPKIETQQKEPKRGYKIEYVNGEGPLAATLGSATQQEFSLSAGNANSVRILNIQSAIWIGDNWIDYFNSPRNIYSFAIPSDYAKSLNINDPITIEYLGRDSETIDIISINKTSKVISEIKALTR